METGTAITLVISVILLFFYVGLKILNSFTSFRLPPPEEELWDFSNSALMDDGCLDLERAVKKVFAESKKKDKITKVKSLKLRNNGISYHGVQSLVNALKILSRPLHRVDIGANKIGDAGAQNLAGYLKELRASDIKSKDGMDLLLDRNAIGAFGVEALAKAIWEPREEKSKSLVIVRELGLSRNMIGNSGAGYLANAIQSRKSSTQNTGVYGVDLSANGIGTEGAIKIFKAVEAKGGIRNINLSGNPIGNEVAESIAACIEQGLKCPLRSISLQNTQLSDDGFKTIIKALRDRDFIPIQNLSVEGCIISDSVLKDLDDIIEVSKNYTPEVLLTYAQQARKRGDFFMVHELCKRAEEKGSTEATCLLAEMYQNGEGVPKNPKEAFEMYRKAARKDDATAMSCLANCYLAGEGVEMDQTRAIELFRRAAERKDPDSTYNLGLCYLKGIGVREPNRDKAYSLFIRAAELGQPLARRLVERLNLRR